MLDALDKIRINNICRLLMEMAEGKFSAQIERSSLDDEIEALVTLVNLMAEEIQQSLTYYSQLNSPESILQFVQMIFILDHNFQILFANEDASLTLKKEAHQLIDQSFVKILSPMSKPDWEKIASKLLLDDHFEVKQKLQFQRENELIKEAICNITSVFHKAAKNRLILVTSFQSITQSQFIEDGLTLRLQAASTGIKALRKKPHILTNPNDLRIIEKIHDFILQHLATPIPSLKELAHNFGTNEFKLKYGFKQLYNITVFKFVIDERLKKASLLIENTNTSIKQIALLTGFKSMSHFSKVFKNKYGHSPMSFRNITRVS